jgi:alkylhydroperoxidase family enzyme
MAHAVISAIVALMACTGIPAFAQTASAPRIPLVQSDTTDPDAAAVLKEIEARGIQPHNIHRTYANAPKIARRLSAVALAIRNDAVVPRVDRELIILRATQLAHGDYQFGEHRPIGISCGIPAALIDGLAQWRDSTVYNERQRAILAYADGMVSAAGVDDKTFAEMKRFFSPREIVELTMTAAYYSGSSQITRALGVQPEPAADPTGYGKC